MSLSWGNVFTTLPSLEKNPAVIATCNSDIGLFGFTGTVDHTPHDGNFNGCDMVYGGSFHLVHDMKQVDITSPTCRTGYNVRSPLSNIQRLEDFKGCPHLIHRIPCQGHANGISNAFGQQGSNTDGGFDEPRNKPPGLCDP